MYDDPELIEVAFAIKLTAPVDKVVHWFFHTILEAGLEFSGWHMDSIVEESGREFHIVAGKLLPSSTRPLAQDQIDKLHRWLRTQEKHLGPTGWLAVTTAQSKRRRREDDNYPASIIGAVTPSKLSVS